MLVGIFSFFIYAGLKNYHVAVCNLMGFILGFSRGIEPKEIIYTKGRLIRLAFTIWSG